MDQGAFFLLEMLWKCCVYRVSEIQTSKQQRNPSGPTQHAAFGNGRQGLGTRLVLPFRHVTGTGALNDDSDVLCATAGNEPSTPSGRNSKIGSNTSTSCVLMRGAFW